MHKKSGCITTRLWFFAGVIGGGIVTSVLYQWIYPPFDPDYGEGTGYAIPGFFWVFVGSIVSGIATVAIMNKKKNDHEQSVIRDKLALEIREKYPRLTSFLASYFPPQEYDYPNHEAVIRDQVAPGFEFEKVVEEGHQMLQEPTIPWQEICYLAELDLNNEPEVRAWLSRILAIIEEGLKE
jgi:hypothetical protein